MMVNTPAIAGCSHPSLASQDDPVPGLNVNSRTPQASASGYSSTPGKTTGAISETENAAERAAGDDR